jgi:bacteriocin-like protein
MKNSIKELTFKEMTEISGGKIQVSDGVRELIEGIGAVIGGSIFLSLLVYVAKKMNRNKAK